jgi:hypothetical protein
MGRTAKAVLLAGCGLLALRGSGPTSRTSEHSSARDVMFGCSDVYHWMGRTAKAVLLAGLRDVLALKSHNLDAMAGESIPMRVLVAD